ncbi:MAG: DUF447 domain-containing protein, partial [Candidatus Thorarchaeota archaeon]
MNSDSLPLELNVIYEVLVTTINEEGKPNIAPMGVKLVNNGEIIIQPFVQSNTFENMWNKEECILNFTKDPYLFTQSTLFQDELTADVFTKIPDSEIPVLKKCVNNYSVLKVLERSKSEESNRALFKCKIIKTIIVPELGIPYTRAHTLLFEILIHASRIESFTKYNIFS